jgi:hypothetical protein
MRRLFPKLCMVIWLSAGVLMLIAPVLVTAQSSSVQPIHTGPMLDQRFYSLVFRHLLYLQTNGEQPMLVDGVSPSIAQFYTNRVGASSTENAALLAEARAWKAEVDPIDNQAHAIIAAIRAKTPDGHLAPGQQPPPVSEQLIELQKQRDAITLKHVANLKMKFGESRFAELDNQIHRATHLSYKIGRINTTAKDKEGQ